jgi:prolipoprotein diacylglyceryltransferase
MAILKKIYKTENLNDSAHEALFLYGIIGIFVGARLGHCFFYDFDYYSKNLIEIILPIKKTITGDYKFGFSGLASHGGTVGLLISLYYIQKI